VDLETVLEVLNSRYARDGAEDLIHLVFENGPL
jgi:hypothetical protein